MFELKVGQELEFISHVSTGDIEIPKGMRVRVGHIIPEMGEERVMLVVLSQGTPRTITVDRHLVTMNSMPIKEAT